MPYIQVSVNISALDLAVLEAIEAIQKPVGIHPDTEDVIYDGASSTHIREHCDISVDEVQRSLRFLLKCGAILRQIESDKSKYRPFYVLAPGLDMLV